MLATLRRILPLRGCAAVALIAMLGGCAHWPQPEAQSPDRVAWVERQAALRSLSQWTLSGRIASTGLFGFSGRVRWQQGHEQFVIDVAGPFGAGATRLSGVPERVEIRNADGTWVTTDPETVLREAYGWTLPLHGLKNWALGLPIDGVPAQVTVNSAGQLQHLEQSGWTIQYESYQQTDVGLDMPQKLTVDNGETRWRLLVDRWSLPVAAGRRG